MVAASDWYSAPAPELETGRLLELLEAHWGLTGTLTRLYAERDLNHRLSTPDDRRWLVKLSHPDTTAARLELEHHVLAHLSADPAAPRVPGILGAPAGASLVPVPGVGHLRVLEWLDGAALGDGAVDRAKREALGRCCARLNRSLAAFAPPPGDGDGTTAALHRDLPRDLPWDLLRFDGLAALTDTLPDAAARKLANTTLDRFARDAGQRLRSLPRQLIHNDLNPDNLLVDETMPDTAPAVIDFGDMVRAPVVCDLAIACAYHVDAGDDPLRHVQDVLRGFQAERPLAAEEQALLADLIAGRLGQTLLIQGARFADGEQDQEDTYRTAARRLEALLDSDRAGFAEAVRATP